MSDEQWTARDERRPRHFWADNEIYDRYARLIGVSAFAVYMALTRHAAKDGTCFPSHQTIGDELGMSRASVLRALHILERYTLIHVEIRRLPVRGQTTNVYTLIQVDKTAVAEIDSGSKTAVANVHPLLHTATPPVAQVDSHINNTQVNKTQLTKDVVDARARAEPPPPTILELTENYDAGDADFDPVEALIEIDFTPAQAVAAQSAYREAEIPLDVAEVARIAHYIAAPPAHIQRPCGYLASQWKLGKVPPLVTPPVKRGPAWDRETQRFEPQPASLPPEVLQERDRLLAEIDATRGQLDPRVVDARAAIARVKLRDMPPAAAPGSYWRNT